MGWQEILALGLVALAVWLLWRKRYDSLPVSTVWQCSHAPPAAHVCIPGALLRQHLHRLRG